MFFSVFGFCIINSIHIYNKQLRLHKPVSIIEAVKLGFTLGYYSLKENVNENPGMKRINKVYDDVMLNKDSIQFVIDNKDSIESVLENSEN